MSVMPDALTRKARWGEGGDLVKATPEQGTSRRVGHPLFITLDTRVAKTALSSFDSSFFFFSLLRQLLLSSPSAAFSTLSTDSVSFSL